MKIFLALSALLAFVSVQSFAQNPGLIINSAEVGVGKFHRKDSQIHPKEYAAGNVWVSSIMPVDAGKTSPVVFSTGQNEVSIQFTSLEQLLNTVVKIAQKNKTKIAVLNITGHGMPGGMWFPTDEKQRQAPECADWNQAATAEDQVNYDQYYDPTSKAEIMEMRQISNMPAHHYGCVTGAAGWRSVVATIPNLKSYFTDNAVINFESCIVGLGSVGAEFSETVGSLVLGGSHAMVKTLTNFGLGDWSFGEGMGFWDYFTDEQLDHDNDVYPKNRSDREIAKPGTLRVTYPQNGKWVTKLVADQNYMMIGYPTSPDRIFSNKPRIVPETSVSVGPLNKIIAPFSLRIPGTAIRVQRMN